MDRLAPEIISNIISHLVPYEYFSPAKFYDETRPPIRCLAHLAALCRHWQPLIEEASFRELKLTSESVSYAIENGVLTPRRLSYIRRLDYSFPSPDEASPPTVSPETDSGFLPLLQLLAQIPLQEEPLVELLVTIPSAFLRGPKYLSKLEDHVQDNFESINTCLPEVPMIRHLFFSDGFDRFFYSPCSICLIAGTMSRLRSLALSLTSGRRSNDSVNERNGKSS
jgi:hypothetical protein